MRLTFQAKEMDRQEFLMENLFLRLREGIGWVKTT